MLQQAAAGPSSCSNRQQLARGSRRARVAPHTDLRAAPAPSVSTANGASSSTQQLSLLKEWAVTCAALGDGSQTILLRKGGIKEPLFRPQAQQFLLFPTAFHTQEQLLKPGVAQRYAQEVSMDPKALPAVPLRHWAVITGAWSTSDPAVLQQLEPLHVWSDAFLDVRLKWRKQQPITLLEVRCYNLPQQLDLPSAEDLWGCFSWLEMPATRLQVARRSAGGDGGSSSEAVQQVLQGAVPALGNAEFAAKQELLRSRVKQLHAEPLEM